jgi:tetratricopeptide (TPR) repeat protein
VSFWKRTLQALGLRKDDDWIAVSGDHLVFRDVERARTIPQEAAQAGPKHLGICERCASPLRKVVFTTAGGGAQAEIWRAYPLAVDGWVCTACGWSAAPRFITPEESVGYARRGAEHAANGELDDAEFWFRRILGSWPGYHAGYADLGQVTSARADAASDFADKERYRREASRWLERAIELDPECTIAGIRPPFARILAMTGDEPRAIELLESVLARNEVAEAVRSAASALLADIRSGKALFGRATELMGSAILEPPAKPLSAAARAAIERGRTMLAEAAERDATFPTLFFLGKSELRLQNWQAACAALQRACEVDPSEVDGWRELTWAYLEQGKAADALPLARRASELKPEDSGLQCNLAVVLLLNGEVQPLAWLPNGHSLWIPKIQSPPACSRCCMT